MDKILEKAYRLWSNADSFRTRRERYKNYTYGDQWCDPVKDRGGRWLREDDYLRKCGGTPLSNNLIRQLVKSIIGRYRSLARESALYSAPATAPLARRNALVELDSREFEEFLISGCAVQRITPENTGGKTDVRVENVDPRMFFVNPYRDPRGWDITLTGMLHDMSMPEIINRFAEGSRARARRLTELFGGLGDFYTESIVLGEGNGPIEFFRSSDDDRHRVIEVWSHEGHGKGPDAARLDFAWHCRWFAPDGTVLAEYTSTYAHGSHPFAIKLYPLTDGEVHSFVEDVIDNQRYINRLMVLLDKMLATSAKGVLLFPLNQLPANYTWKEVTEVWAQTDGVLPITGNGTTLPHQLITNPGNSSAYQLLQTQLSLFDSISGVNGALLGRTDGTTRGAAMYDSQVQNGTIALADIFESFESFAAMRNEKALATLPSSSREH